MIEYQYLIKCKEKQISANEIIKFAKTAGIHPGDQRRVCKASVIMVT